MQECMRLKYLSVTTILTPNLTPLRLSLSYLISFYRLWPTQGRNDSPPKRAETTHLPRPKRPTPKIGRNDPGRNDPGRNDPGPKRPGFIKNWYIGREGFPVDDSSGEIVNL